MRVGSLQMTTRYMNQLNRTYEQQTKLMEQSDGAKLHRPSDDPIGYSKYLRYSISYGENNQYQYNVKTAISWMKNSDSSLVDITNCFKTIVEKSNQAQGTNTDADMRAIAQEMLVQAQQAVSDANIQINGRYLFSGQRDLVQPYNISYDKMENRGLTKTLDDKQEDFFTDASRSGDLVQMLVVKGDNGNKYFLNTKTGAVYTEEFVEEGYKAKISAGQPTVDKSDLVHADHSASPENTNYQHYEQRLADADISLPTDEDSFATAMGYTNPDEDMVIVKDGSGKEYYGDSKTGKVYDVEFVTTGFKKRYNEAKDKKAAAQAIIDDPTATAEEKAQAEKDKAQAEKDMTVQDTDSVGTYPSGTYAAAPRTSKTTGMYVLKDLTDGSDCYADPETGAVSATDVAGGLEFTEGNTGIIKGDLYSQNQKYSYAGVVKLDADQQAYFGGTDFVKVTGADGKEYYYNPSLSDETSHDLYTKEFFESGYKNSSTAKVRKSDAADSMDALYVAKNFDSRGVIKDDGTDKAAGVNWKTTYVIDGRMISMSFDTVEQYIVTYQGDKKQFSMVKENGAVQPATDTVNASGIEIAGSSIFDNADSGNEYSGANAFNDMLTVVAMCNRGESSCGWMSSDGKTLANNAYNTVLNSESKLAARQQVYSDCSDMLVTQNETILGDITDVHSTDVAKLAVEMMTAQTIYQLSLSVGSRILPPTLADYL